MTCWIFTLKKSKNKQKLHSILAVLIIKSTKTIKLNVHIDLQKGLEKILERW